MKQIIFGCIFIATSMLIFACGDSTSHNSQPDILVDEDLLADCPDVDGVEHPLDNAASLAKSKVSILISAVYTWYDIQGNYVQHETLEMHYDPNSMYGPSPQASDYPEGQGYYILKSEVEVEGRTQTSIDCIYIMESVNRDADSKSTEKSKTAKNPQIPQII